MHECALMIMHKVICYDHQQKQVTYSNQARSTMQDNKLSESKIIYCLYVSHGFLHDLLSLDCDVSGNVCQVNSLVQYKVKIKASKA